MNMLYFKTVLQSRSKILLKSLIFHLIIMSDSKQKLIPFSPTLEQAIQEDADRCKRSFIRQVEAVLMTYYGIEDVEIDRSRLEMIGELAPHSKKKIPNITIDLSDEEGNSKKRVA